MHKINDTAVSNELYLAASAAKRRGGLVFLSILEMAPDRPISCQNCNGAGSLTLQMATAGPSDIPPVISWSPSGESNIWHNGKWYGVKTTVYDCPACTGRR